MTTPSDNRCSLLSGTYVTEICAENVDVLVERGVNHILAHGARVDVRAGSARQAYCVNYILENPLDRLHLNRAGAIRYLCRELQAYFAGSLQVSGGLSHAAPFWTTLQDEKGEINSNYGYYVFYEPVKEYGTQYNWVVKRLVENVDTRRAIININQVYHKSETLDFPCTVAIQFYVRDNYLVCLTSSRSTDVVTGLPYDMGFFSFLHELLYRDLVERGMDHLKLGPTIIKAAFTQIYDKTYEKALAGTKPINSGVDKRLQMPRIGSAKGLLTDIYSGSAHTPVAKWISENAR